MRILLTRVLVTAVIIAGAFVSYATSNPEHERDRDRKASANLEMMDHLHDPDDETHPGLIGLDSDHHLQSQGGCEPIKVGLCMGVGYNHTTMPNLVGHDVQADADALLQTFTPLIQYGCSPHLKLFLCSAYVPMCTDKVPQPIGPCRSLCNSVRRKCEPVLTEFGFEWPPSLECSKFFPENNHQYMCIPGPHENAYNNNPSNSRGGSSSSDSSSLPSNANKDYKSPSVPNHRDSSISVSRKNDRNPFDLMETPHFIQNSNNNPHSPSSVDIHYPANNGGGGATNFGGVHLNPSIIKDHGGKSPVSSIGNVNNVVEDSFLQNSRNQCIGSRRVWSKGSCWIKCPSISSSSSSSLTSLNSADSPSSSQSDSASLSSSSEVLSFLFHPTERDFARRYALLWAILSLSAAMIALTLSACSPRFSIAERPILYLALCQVMFSIGVIVGSTVSVSCFVDKSTGMELLAGDGMIPSSCAVVFLLTYFFGTAATLWWVILCLSWLLSLNRALAINLQQREWSMFHLTSWGLASILTSTALVHKKVDADELTGICGVGFQDMDALKYYSLVPVNICLTIGIIFLLLGLLCRLFPTWNASIFSMEFLKPKSCQQNRLTNCELSSGGSSAHQHPHLSLGGPGTASHLQSSFRAPPGYSPVLVLPNHNHHHNHHVHHGHGSQCTASNCHSHHSHMGHFTTNCVSGSCGGGGGGSGSFHSNNNATSNASNATPVTNVPVTHGQQQQLFGGNSPASVVGIGGLHRLRASENSKAVWMRVGIFALVHSLPIACQVGTMAYELSGREEWELGTERPNLQIFLLRLNMNLIAGLTTGVWVLSTYSWKSLSNLTHRFCHCVRLSRNLNPKSPHHQNDEQKLPVAVVANPLNSAAAPLLLATVNSSSSNNPGINSNTTGAGIIAPSNSALQHPPFLNTLPVLSSNNTFTTQGALAPSAMTGSNVPRTHHHHHHHHQQQHPLPPLPARNPPELSAQQQRTDAWRRGETIV